MSTRGWENVKAIVSPAKPPRQRVQRPQVGRSKFGAVRTVVNGWTFDSKREAARYLELLAIGELGEIRNLELQPRFPIRARANDAPVTVIVARYVADFRYEERNPKWFPTDTACAWRDVVEDVKGAKTPMYRLKKKLVEAQYGIVIREIR
jgi:hypothetical protein